MELQSKSIFVAGHQGMVGKAVVRALENIGATKLVLRTRSDLDLCDQSSVHQFFKSERPEVVIFAASKVGGIHANNSYPAQFLYENLMMAANAIHAAHLIDTERFLFLGSTCVYPRLAPQPMREDCLLGGPLEPTNEAYALAKISGLKLCQFYRSQYGRLFHSAMPTNLYGKGDNYHPENSHVLPAMIRKFHEAKVAGDDQAVIWGTGTPRREFLHVDDLASGLLHLLGLSDPPNLVNIGTGRDITILDLAREVAKAVGYQGQIATDPSKPDGTPVKLTDMTRMHELGWHARIDLQSGLERTYQDFLQETEQGVLREA